MIISIASGKGGTGKTTIAINLALALGEGVELLDCDVEEPNAHLFLQPEFDSEVEVETFVPVIREERCTACGKCSAICRFRALAVVAKKVLVFPELCHSCGGCLLVCPEEAIADGHRSLGVVSTGHCGEILFRHGRLRVGEAMAPPLIRRVRATEAGRAKTTIIDAPPGTSCPVIAAMRGSDFVLLVTEPTPFGLHDLRLAVEAVKVLGIPQGLVINRADIGDGAVREYAAAENIPVLLEIPFVREIAEAYSRGVPIVTAFPEYRQIFRDLYAQIEQRGRQANG
jgi:MinD superfamily P-loop ATPase